MSSPLLPTPGLFSLSDEVLVRILYYLFPSASSLLHVASTHPRLLRLSRDRKVVQSLRLDPGSTVTDSTLKLLLPPSLPVESLSILCSSLSPSLTCSLLCRLPSLTSLSLVGLRIGSNHFASLLSSLPLLTCLSFTWTRIEGNNTFWEGLRPSLEKLTGLQVHLAPSPEEHCPLDQLTQMLALTPHLTSLTVYTHRLPAAITDSPARFNIVTNFAEVCLKHLNSLVLVLQNRTFPILMLKQFLMKVTAAVDSSELDLYWVDYGDSWSFRDDLGMPDYRRLNHSTVKRILDLEYARLNPRVQHNTQGCKEMVIIEPGLHLCKSDETENTLHLQAMKGESLQGLKVKENNYSNGRAGYKCNLLAQTWLTSIKFSQLSCLSSPLCLLLEEQPSPQDPVEPTPGRVSHSRTKTTYSTSPLLKLARAVPTLKEMCVWSCGNPYCCRDGGSLLQALAYVRGLRILRISDLQVTFPGPLFPALFSSCLNLEELQLVQLQTSNQQLCKDLTAGLMEAPSLKILRLRQKQLGTNMVQKLLEGLKTCTKLEQVILMDPSMLSLTSRVFPAIQALQLVQAMPSIRLLYITSPLLTLQSAKSLKAELKALKRKHLVYSLHPPVRGEVMYQWEHLSSLPGDLLESLLCLSSSNSSDIEQFSYSDIGKFSYRHLLQ